MQAHLASRGPLLHEARFSFQTHLRLQVSWNCLQPLNTIPPCILLYQLALILFQLARFFFSPFQQYRLDYILTTPATLPLTLNSSSLEIPIPQALLSTPSAYRTFLDIRTAVLAATNRADLILDIIPSSVGPAVFVALSEYRKVEFPAYDL
ncbi:hypothetical protein BDW72DRAFT_185461 [Aspergillus terricola var. indicus]